jgi:uncharacterized protein with ATP-grasp and redox domains
VKDGLGLKEKLTERAQPFLDDGETVKAVFMARSGVAPDERTVNPLSMLRRARNHIIVATNKGTVVLDATLMRSTVPTGVGERSRKPVRVIDKRGIWTEITLEDIYWVHKRFADELKAVAKKR